MTKRTKAEKPDTKKANGRVFTDAVIAKVSSTVRDLRWRDGLTAKQVEVLVRVHNRLCDETPHPHDVAERLAELYPPRPSEGREAYLMRIIPLIANAESEMPPLKSGRPARRRVRS